MVRAPPSSLTGATDREQGGRFFVAERLLLLIRYDPLTRDNFARVRLELDAKTGGGRVPPTDAFALQAATGPLIVPVSTSGRDVAELANVNIADAVGKIVAPDGLSRYLDITPLASTRKANSYRSADEIDLELSWQTVPLDARLVRSMLLLHFSGTIPASAFASGVRERSPGSATPSGWTIPATYKNLRFIGLADEIEDEHSDGQDVLRVRGRDLTSILLDNKVPPAVMKVIKQGTTILDAIRALLATLPAAQLIRGPFPRPGNLALRKVTSTTYARNATSAKAQNQADEATEAGAAGADPAAQRGSSKEGETYWDAITDLCVAHGLVPMIELDKLVVQEPRTYFSGSPEIAGSPGTPSFPTPLRRKLGQRAGEPRVMVYGRNVQSLKFKRKLAGVKAPHVRVLAYDPEQKDAAKRLVRVDYPSADNKQATSVDPTGQNASTEFFVVPVYGIRDPGLLRSIARQTYENIGHGEFGLSFTTSDPASLGPRTPTGEIDVRWDPNEDPDLLDLKAGDPIRVLVTPTERRTGALYSISELNQMVARAQGLADMQAAVAFLVQRGWQRDHAVQLVKVLRSANLPDVFRVQGVTFTHNGETGDFSISVDARDYVRVRADQSDPANTGGVGPRAVARGGTRGEAAVDASLAPGGDETDADYDGEVLD